MPFKGYEIRNIAGKILDIDIASQILYAFGAAVQEQTTVAIDLDGRLLVPKSVTLECACNALVSPSLTSAPKIVFANEAIEDL